MARIAAAVIVILAIIQWRYAGPSPAPATATASEFSATRAFDTLKSTIGSIPHPLGVAEHDAVRDRIVARFKSLGYDTRVDSRFACNAQPVCANVSNIIASIPGAARTPAVLLAAHYDSVPAGPGASDDGAGVATLLEIARVMRNERTRNPLTFLIDDGEEAGLLGAEAFVAAEPAAEKSIAGVINAEARGTGGPSYLFETSRNNGRIAPLVFRALPRPITSSVFPAIYDLLPNDTDLTVFKRNGYSGVNFAFIKNVVFYHSPLDDAAHLSLRTLQHHGDSILAATRALANAQLPLTADHNDVWFDVLSFFVVAWPAPWSLAIAIAALVISVIAVLVVMRRESHSVTGSWIGLGLLWIVCSIIATVAGGLAIANIVSIRSKAGFATSPLAELLATWTWAALCVVALRRAFGRVGPSSIIGAAAIFYSVIAIAVSVGFTGGSYLFIVPAVVLALSIAGVSLNRLTVDSAAVITCTGSSVVLLPLASQLYAALGRTALPVIGLIVALIAITAVAALPIARRTLLAALAFAIIVFTVIAALLPVTTAERPARNSLAYFDDGARPRWLVRSMTPAISKTASFGATPHAAYPAAAPAYAAPAPYLALPRVALDGSMSNGTVRFHVRSNRDAQRVVLFFKTDAAIEQLRVDGVAPPPPPARFRAGVAPPWHRVVVRGSSMTVDALLRGSAGVEAYALDYSFGLPAAGALLANARAASNQVPSDDGDVTITMTSLRSNAVRDHR